MASFGLAVAFVRLDRPAVGLGTPLACERAQVIDGELRCDDEVVDGPSGLAPAELAALDQPVDVNRASAQEIASLPGIGPTIAARIVAGRPYASVEALLEIEGIGPKRLEAMRERVRLGP
jgi:DNA uptake protein ComE-like DNA-binding protein